MLHVALVTIILSTSSHAVDQSQVRNVLWHTNPDYAAAHSLPLKRSTSIAELPDPVDAKRMIARQVTDAESPQAVDPADSQDVYGMESQVADSSNPQDIDNTNLQVVGGVHPPPPPFKTPGGNIFNLVCKHEIGEPFNIVTHVDVMISTDGNTQSIATASRGHVELQCRRYKLTPSQGDELEIDIISRSECESHLQITYPNLQFVQNPPRRGDPNPAVGSASVAATPRGLWENKASRCNIGGIVDPVDEPVMISTKLFFTQYFC